MDAGVLLRSQFKSDRRIVLTGRRIWHRAGRISVYYKLGHLRRLFVPCVIHGIEGEFFRLLDDEGPAVHGKVLLPGPANKYLTALLRREGHADRLAEIAGCGFYPGRGGGRIKSIFLDTDLFPVS